MKSKPFSRRYFKQKPFIFRAYEAISKPKEIQRPSKKALFLLLLLGLGSLLLYDFALRPRILTVSGALPSLSNTQWLFRDDYLSGNIGNWNSILASYQTHVNPLPGRGIKLTANSTHSATAIAKTSFGIDTIGSHELAVTFNYCFENTPANVNQQWGLFLTRNGTLPLTANYDPRSDTNTILALMVQDIGGGSISTFTEIQNDPQKTILNGIFSGIQQGQGPLFSLFSTTQNLVLCSNAGGAYTTISLLLNFTGNAGSNTAVSKQWVDRSDTPGIVENNVVDFPHLQFQGANVYPIIWVGPCIAGGCSPLWFVGTYVADPSIWSFGIKRGDPPIAPIATPSQSIDTGGFFGPLVKALIAIGIFILTAIASFLGFVVNAFVNAMNAVGSFLGLGNIGTAIRDTLNGIGSFITNVLGGIVGQVLNAISFFASGLTAFLAIVGGFWTRVTNFFGAIANFAGLVWTIFNDVFNSTIISANVILFFDYLWGLYYVYEHGAEGLWKWIDIHERVFFRIGTIMYKLGDHALTQIWKVKNTIVGWI